MSRIDETYVTTENEYVVWCDDEVGIGIRSKKYVIGVDTYEWINTWPFRLLQPHLWFRTTEQLIWRACKKVDKRMSKKKKEKQIDVEETIASIWAQYPWTTTTSTSGSLTVGFSMGNSHTKLETELTDAYLTAPEQHEVVIGYRVFTLCNYTYEGKLDLTLVGGYRQPWHNKLMEARCLKSNTETSAKHLAHNTCECGIYSHKEKPTAADGQVIAEVLNYGWIIPGSKGYRSEFCEIKKLWLYMDSGVTDRYSKYLAEKYEVECEAIEPLISTHWETVLAQGAYTIPSYQGYGIIAGAGVSSYTTLCPHGSPYGPTNCFQCWSGQQLQQPPSS